MFSLIWFSGFRGENLNVKVYDVWKTDGRRQMPSDGKSSHGLQPGELTKLKIIKKEKDPETTIPNNQVKFEQYWVP